MDKESPLILLLLGTVKKSSPLQILRGKTDVLKIIGHFICEEMWSSQILKFSNRIPTVSDKYHRTYQEFSGAPVAIVRKNIEFPPVTEEKELHVNMMPFNVYIRDSLPPECRHYFDLVMSCTTLLSVQGIPKKDQIGYITIDEREVSPNSNERPQRRPGVHVENAGFLPVSTDSTSETSCGLIIPGREHHWGNGLMLGTRFVTGGIFMVSNIANSTAIWNSRILNNKGDMIGPHGELGRMRTLLGPPTKLLEAGELVWITDKTPHESLPIPPGTRRQYFRLVVGEVTAWFADHCTANPLGIKPPANVRIVTGNKFNLYNEAGPVQWGRLWSGGTPDDIEKAKQRLLEEIKKRKMPK